MSIGNDNYSGRYDQGVRYVKRVEEPRLPFVPYGLIPLLALLGIFWWGLTSFANNIEKTTLNTAQSALDANGLDWTKVDVSGQTVTLSGTPPSQDAIRNAERVVDDARAENTVCQSPPCKLARSIFNPVSATTPAVTTPTPTSPTETAPVTAGPYPEFEFSVTDGTLLLEGDMPSQLARKTVVDTARASIDNTRIFAVEDELTVTNKPTADGFLNVALRGVNTVSRCDRGRSSFLGDYFSLRCELPQSRAGRVQTLASSPLPIGSLGAIDILPNEAVASCEASMSLLLSTAQIRFPTGSAEISGTSNSDLLDSIAIAARECPGRLRIEGHTDSTGSALKNEELSGQRAEAVRDALVRRGLPIDRLTAQGFGSSQPTASNATTQGRAQNRRIEIRVVRTSE